MTPKTQLTLLNQFGNFVKCVSCNHGTDEQLLSTPEHIQPIQQGRPLTLGIRHLLETLLRSIMIFRLGGVYTNTEVGLGLVVGLNPNTVTQCVQDYMLTHMQLSMIYRKTCGDPVTVM